MGVFAPRSLGNVQVFVPKDYDGELVIIQQTGEIPDFLFHDTVESEKNPRKRALTANVTSVTGSDSGETAKGVVIQQTALLSILDDANGLPVAGRIRKQKAKGGGNPYWIIDQDISIDEENQASEIWDAVGTPSAPSTERPVLGGGPASDAPPFAL